MRYLKLLIITIFLQSNYAGVFLSKIQEVSSLIENQGSFLLRKFSNQSTLVKSCLVTSSVLNILASSYLLYHYKNCQKRAGENYGNEREACLLEQFNMNYYLPFNVCGAIRNVLCLLRNKILCICLKRKCICGTRISFVGKQYSSVYVDKLKILFDIKIVLDIYLFLHVMIIIVRPLSLRHE